MSTTGHRWSGWPGAICLDCGAEDQGEICMADCPFGNAWLCEMQERDFAKEEGRYRQDVDVPTCSTHVNGPCPVKTVSDA